MNWKYVTLHCPHCEFEHQFKRDCWWEQKDIYIGLYNSDDMKSRKDCHQQLVFGETKGDALYELGVPYLEKSNRRT